MIDLRPSSSSIWVPCAAMPRFSALLPEEPSSDPAREGTCAAWVAEMVLTGAAPTAEAMIGETHENGWLVEKVMASFIQDYVDHLRRYGGQIYVERKVRLNEMIAGTPDAYATTLSLPDGRFDLIVDDLKYGYDIVHAYRNTQISIYAGAIVRGMPDVHLIRNVIIGVYQPRATSHSDGIYRTWVTTVPQLMEFVAVIEQAGHNAQAVDAPATPGFHCEHCPAAHTCQALTHSVYKGFRVITSDQRGTLTAEQLAQELDFIDMMTTMVKARRTSLHAEAIARMNRAEFVPGYGFDNERYGNSKLTVDVLGAMAITGVDAREQKLVTPAELIRRGADKKVVASISSRPRIPPKLVKFDDDHHKRLFAKKEK